MTAKDNAIAPELKACPFCGSAPETLKSDDGSVECPTCGAFGPCEPFGFNWNTRPTPAPAAMEAEEFLAAAHERAKKPLVALDIRNKNLGSMGVMWVETKTALDAIRAAITALQSHPADCAEGPCPACNKPLTVISDGSPDDLVKCGCTVVSLEWAKLARSALGRSA
jgi:uncharacterized Zn finger protein (UPF0148 family)